MSDLHQILPLWRELSDSGQDYVLATVVQIDGSGYRKPGARMIVAADGRRAGAISGGCLEADVARKAFWHTESGPTLRFYSTNPEDGDVPYGMGCGGVIHVFLERSATANFAVAQIARYFNLREPHAIATLLEGGLIGQRAYWSADASQNASNSGLADLAHQGFLGHHSFCTEMKTNSRSAKVFVEWLPARTGLFVFGAGDDAVPLVKLAQQMGWFVTVLDGRAHLATRARFPEAHEMHVLTPEALSGLLIRPGDAAVLMTHSLEQDTRALRFVLDQDLAYIGVLGPRRRTEQMLVSISDQGFGPASAGYSVESLLGKLHAPMGLDLGGNTPPAIALAAVAEIQRCLGRATGKPLSELRASSSSFQSKFPPDACTCGGITARSEF